MDVAIIHRYKQLASSYGVTSTNRVDVLVWAVNKKGIEVLRKMWMTPNVPPFPQNEEIWLWFNPVTSVFYKSSNWKPGTVTWETVDEYDLLFNEEDLTSTSGNTSANILEVLQTNPNLLDSAVQVAIANMTNTLTQIQSLSDLRAISTTSLHDKSLRYVENENEFYAYDLQSSASEDAPYIIVPNSGAGRWNRVDQKIVDGGQF
jgi:hypothetical protein